MANATKLPALSYITFTQLSRPGAENPRLSQAVSASGTTLKSLYQLLGSDGNVITEAMLMGIRNENSYVETVLVPSGSLEYDAQTANFTVGSVLTGGTSGAKAIIVRDTDSGATGTLTLVVYSGAFQNNETITDDAGGSATVNGTLTTAISADGKTITGVVRGINLDGLDWITGDTDLAVSHKAGDAIFCNISGVIGALITATLTGTLATGGTGFVIGTEPGASGETTTLYRTTTPGVRKGFFRWSSNFAQFSNDGTTWVNCSDVSASDLAKVSANDTTPGYLNGKLVEGDGIDFTENNDGGNETLTIAVDVTEIISGDFGLEASSNDLRVKLAATPGLEFSTGLKAKVDPTGGITINSNGLALSEAFNPTSSYMSYESLTEGQAVALLPIEVKYFDQLTEANLSLGDANARRKYAVKFYPSRVPSFTTLSFRGKENGTSVAHITLTIETDNAGAPSGTAVTNGTAAALDSSGWTTSYGTRTATFPGVPTMVAGTAYWLVFSSDTTDAANYVILGVNSSYDEHYLTFERQTYNLDTATWGGSVTNATPFFWTNSAAVSLGAAIVPTDADWAGRTWSFVGIVNDTVSAYTDVDVYTDIAPNMTLVEGATYYLSSTAGALTTTRQASSLSTGAAGYQIGRGNNATDLKIELGRKEMWGNINATATTVSTLNAWFPWKKIIINGGCDANGTGFFSSGFQDGANTYEVQSISDGLGDNYGSANVWGTTLGNGYLSVISNTSDTGATLTTTKSGTSAGFSLNIFMTD